MANIEKEIERAEKTEYSRTFKTKKRDREKLLEFADWLEKGRFFPIVESYAAQKIVDNGKRVIMNLAEVIRESFN